MSAEYFYNDPLDLLQWVSYGNGAGVSYEYDDANRITEIHHFSHSASMLHLIYTWTDHDLPATITEYRFPGLGDPVVLATTTFTYDARKRLVREVRTGQNAYHLTYGYGKNGNRTKKIQADIGGGGFVGGKRIEYHYDVDPPQNDPFEYPSFNNRLEYYDTFDTTGGGSVPVSRTWYYYRNTVNTDRDKGNVKYVVTGPPQAAMQNNMMSSGPSGGGGGPLPEEVEGAALSAIEAEGLIEGEVELSAFGSGDGGSMSLLGSYCGVKKEFTATRMEYAYNDEAVSYVVGEHWCSNAAGTTTPTKYEVLWAREFRYDGARQRYLNVELDVAPMQGVPAWQPMPIVPVSITRSDYDGDDVYADWSEPIPGSTDPPTLLRSFEPGIARVEPWTDSGGANTYYYHTDLLGTTRMMTDPDGSVAAGYGGSTMPTPATFTAFGERVQGPTDGEGNRYGYVGEHGYQSHEEFPYLHLGARYYDPAMGRFLQRDPIGINGGSNVYAYAMSTPTMAVDPSGLEDHGPNGFIDKPTSFDNVSLSDIRKSRPVRRMVALAVSCARETTTVFGRVIRAFSRVVDVLYLLQIPGDNYQKPREVTAEDEEAVEKLLAGY